MAVNQWHKYPNVIPNKKGPFLTCYKGYINGDLGEFTMAGFKGIHSMNDQLQAVEYWMELPAPPQE